jgi:hypothetical protein
MFVFDVNDYLMRFDQASHSMNNCLFACSFGLLLGVVISGFMCVYKRVC